MNIFIADRNQLFRESLKILFENEGFASVSTHRNNIEDLVPEIEKNLPDIILTEYIDNTKSAAALKNITLNFPSIKFLVIGFSFSEKEYHQLIQLGVKGCILKESDLPELKNALQEVVSGKVFFPGDILQKVMIKHSKIITGKNSNNLTEREMEIIYLLCDGFSNEEISEKLHLSYDTIKWHRGNIFLKSGCKNILSLYKYAIQNKFIT